MRAFVLVGRMRTRSIGWWVGAASTYARGIGSGQHEKVRDAQDAGDIDKVLERVLLALLHALRRVRQHDHAQVVHQLLERPRHATLAHHKGLGYLLTLSFRLLDRSRLLVRPLLLLLNVRHKRISLR